MKYLALLASLATAVVARQCTNVTVPVSLTSRNGKFDIKLPENEIETTNFFLNFAKQGANYTQQVEAGFETIKGDYKLVGTYCHPDDGAGSALQILTHGIGFDRHYWDLSYNNYNYSYVNEALDQGYATFAWDRLGVGESSHGDPLSEIQVHLEIAALTELTNRLKAGNVCNVPKYEKTVLIGHSFGSIISYAVSSKHPDITEAIVLTGFAQAGNFIGMFALGGNFAPVKENKMLADKYAVGYVAPKSSIGVHINFFGPDDFDPKILDVATMTGQPATFGELLTTSAGAGMPSDFTGSVLIITGDRDIPFCGGDCMNTMAINGTAANLLEPSKMMFKKASDFNATVVPNAGHGLNYGYSHTSTYSSILDFIKRSL